jgi:hypothetical protein
VLLCRTEITLMRDEAAAGAAHRATTRKASGSDAVEHERVTF